MTGCRNCIYSIGNGWCGFYREDIYDEEICTHYEEDD